MTKGILALAVATLVSVSAQAGLSDYAGTYSGKFERSKGAMTIGVSGGMMTASFVSAKGSGDILGGSCGSTIGKMLKLDMDGSKVDYAVFAFDPGACANEYEGRELTLDFKHDDGKVEGLNASVFIETTSSTDWQCTGGYPGGSTCFPDTQITDWYATGKFKK